MYAKREKIYPIYVSKHNSNREKQDIILKIQTEKDYGIILQQKKITSIIKTNYINGDFYCLNSLHSSGARNKLESHQKVYIKKKDFCSVIMSSKDIEIFEFYQYQKSDEAPFIIYADLELLRSLSSNDHTRMQSIDSIETYAYGTRKALVSFFSIQY